jgi:formylglycine-generating enzyme required for sulfatase activity
MGDTFGTGGPEEKPVHRVCVDGFSLGKNLVTQAQWQEVMGENPSYFKQCGGNCPVEKVSWNDAQAFLQRLNEQTGKNYRLPSEAQWEYAARSGGKNEQWAGTSDIHEFGAFAWLAENSGGKTHPVGSRRPNGLGLYDMTGNVWEWCNDWYDEGYYKQSPEKNPQGPASGNNRVLRGGSWNDAAPSTRASERWSYAPVSNYYNFGFRLMLPERGKFPTKER